MKMTLEAQSTKLDLEKISAPELCVSVSSLAQLELMTENDPTLEGKFLRILVNGKGCAGFDYATGFDFPREDDFRLNFQGATRDLTIILDPFTAYYLKLSELDYVQDFENDREGFVVKNLEQDKFNGKFWKKHKELVPPLKKKS
jgi:iron-sulfur cluster insertion protein